MREWLTVIIVLLILGVLLDGWRRMRQAKKQAIRMNLKAHKLDDDKVLADPFTSELPNGGARVVGHRDLENARELTRHLQNSYGKKKRVVRARPAEAASLNLDEDVPMLMDSVDDPRYQERSLHHDDDFEPEDILMTGGRPTAAERQDERRYVRQPLQQELLDDDYERDDYAADDYDEPHAYGDQEYDDQEVDDELDAYREPDHYRSRRYVRDGRDEMEPAAPPAEDPDDDDFDPADYDPDDFDPSEYEEPEDYEEEPAEDYPQSQKHSAQMVSPGEEAEHEPQEVLVINVMSSGSARFYGPDLVDVIFDCGMRYGDMHIFHRYEDEDGDGPLLFSMANMVVPGTFDLDTIDEFETPGVSLFMTLPMQSNSMEAFNIMAETAKAIAVCLGGELKDEQRSVMTAQTLEHCRHRIREFERKRLSRG